MVQRLAIAAVVVAAAILVACGGLASPEATQPPAGVQPTQPPAETQPTQPPAGVQPTQPPTDPEATQTPIEVQPTQPPQETPPSTASPAGAGTTLLGERCTVCHSLDRVTSASKTRQEWEQTVTRMVGKGAKLNTDEQEILISHLAETYGP